eukprot:848216_1
MVSKDLHNVKIDFEKCRAHFIDLYAKLNKHQDDITNLVKGSQEDIDEKLMKMKDDMDEIRSSANEAVTSVNRCRGNIDKLTSFELADRANITKLDESVSLLKTQQENRSGLLAAVFTLAEAGSHIVPVYGPMASTAAREFIFSRIEEMQTKNAAYVNFLRSHDGKKITVSSPNIKRNDDSDVRITFVGKNGKKVRVTIPHSSLQFQGRFTDANPNEKSEMHWHMVISLDNVYGNRDNVKLSDVPALACSVPLYDFKQWQYMGLSSSKNNIVWTSQENLTAGCSVTDKIDVKKINVNFPVGKRRNKPVQYVFYE